jgi:hypothetical protein
MLSRLKAKLPIAAFFCVLGCGTNEPAQAPTPAPTPPEPPSSAEPAGGTAGAADQASEPRKRGRPFEVKNSCGDVSTVVFAEDPKAASAGRRTIAPSATIDGPRDNDGNQTVWLLDANGEPLVKVHVTRGMKRVEIGKSCRTLDAR